MLDIEFPSEQQNADMPSLNHSYICSQILRQLFTDDKIEAFTELTLDMATNLSRLKLVAKKSHRRKRENESDRPKVSITLSFALFQ